VCDGFAIQRREWHFSDRLANPTEPLLARVAVRITFRHDPEAPVRWQAN
jgi:hypothetical protein